MQTNWSLIINILLLVAVVIAIYRLMKIKRAYFPLEDARPSLGSFDALVSDDILSVRKVDDDAAAAAASKPVTEQSSGQKPGFQPAVKHSPPVKKQDEITNQHSEQSLMLILVAKEGRQFAGYDLLQTLLSTGLRFGDGHMFHRHQFANGQGPVLCSLAAATSSGTFDMQNMGAFNVKGLCLFMHTSNNSTIDSERFSIMIETARQLSEGLDCHLLDDQRKLLTDERIEHYHKRMNMPD